MLHLSQVYTHGMLQTLQNDRNHRQESMITLVNIRGLSRLLACKARGRGFVRPIVLNLADSKKPQRLARGGNKSQPTSGRIQGAPLSQ